MERDVSRVQVGAQLTLREQRPRGHLSTVPTADERRPPGSTGSRLLGRSATARDKRRALAMRYKSAMDADALLAALLEATEHYEQDARHARWDGAFLSFVNANGLKPGLLGDAAGEQVKTALIDDLVDAGSLRLEPPQAGAGIERKFALTSDGRRRARALAVALLVGQTDAVDVSWRRSAGGWPPSWVPTSKRARRCRDCPYARTAAKPSTSARSSRRATSRRRSSVPTNRRC